VDSAAFTGRGGSVNVISLDVSVFHILTDFLSVCSISY
jgi:hypothetical protein